MRIVFQHTASEALTIVPDAIELTFTDVYFVVRCANSVGYFPSSAFRFLGLDSRNAL